MTEWTVVQSKKKAGSASTQPPELRTARQWFEGWGFTVSTTGATYKPLQSAPNRDDYRASSKANPKGYICHARLVWSGCSDYTPLTQQQAWAQLRNFHITVEQFGADDTHNPHYYFAWDLAEAGSLDWDPAKASTAGDQQQRADCQTVAGHFVVELTSL
jgi:hypothetical protein